MKGLVRTPDEMPINPTMVKVVKSWEEAVSSNWNGKFAHVSRKTILDKLFSSMDVVDEAEMIRDGYLDVAEIFEANNWIIKKVNLPESKDCIYVFGKNK